MAAKSLEKQNEDARRPKTAWSMFLQDFKNKYHTQEKSVDSESNNSSGFDKSSQKNRQVGKSKIDQFNMIQKAASAAWRGSTDEEKAVINT